MVGNLFCQSSMAKYLDSGRCERDFLIMISQRFNMNSVVHTQVNHSNYSNDPPRGLKKKARNPETPRPSSSIKFHGKIREHVDEKAIPYAPCHVCYIYLHFLAILEVNVGRDSIHGASGIVFGGCPNIVWLI